MLHSNRSSLVFEEDLSRISKYPQETSSVSQDHSANTSNKSPSNTSNKKMGMLMATGHKRDKALESPGFGNAKERAPTLVLAEQTLLGHQLFPEPQLGHKLTCDEIDNELMDLKDTVNDDLMISGAFLELVDGTPDPKKPIPSSSQLGYEMSNLPVIPTQRHPSQLTGARDRSRESSAIDTSNLTEPFLDLSLHDRTFELSSN